MIANEIVCLIIVMQIDIGLSLVLKHLTMFTSNPRFRGRVLPLPRSR